jgi:hypothetical protein
MKLNGDDLKCLEAVIAYAKQHCTDLYPDGEASTSEMWRKFRRGRELINKVRDKQTV